MTVEIKVRENGPYRVKGEVRLVDAQGNEIDTAPYEKDGTIVLCRCGASKTKPFCDKSHATVCFRA
jgi:CDGSH-type Zn-finger protein